MDYAKALDLIESDCRHEDRIAPFRDAASALELYLPHDVRDERARARRIREVAERKCVEWAQCGRAVQADELYGLIEHILKVNAPHDLDSYMLFMEWNRHPSKRFWMHRRDVLMPVCEGFQALEDDEIDILLVSMPPRTGKSTTGVFATTWHMGRYPESACLMSGYADKLTKGFHSEALSIISSSEYRFAEVFPDSPLKWKSYSDCTIHLACKQRFPTLTCRPVEGTLTGAVEVGHDGWLYCDDLVRDIEEASSAERMDKLYSAYHGQLFDRKLPGAKEVHIGTRWVPNDPIGHIIELHEGDPRCRVINLPALDGDGRSNFMYGGGHAFDEAHWDGVRRSLIESGDEDQWRAKYMCDPFFKHGVMFPRGELRYFDELPNRAPDAVLAVCDTKDRGKDYAVQPVGYVYGGDHYIFDVVCDNGMPETVEPKLARSLARNRVDAARYESNSAGGRVADSVEEECRSLGCWVKMSKKYSTENKETRILVDSGWVKERCLFRREPPNEDYRRFMDMLTRYTVEGKNKHDDAPDAMSMYKRFATGMVKAKATPMRRLA